MDSYYKLRQLFFITKCDTVYYKLRQVLQSAMNLCNISQKSFCNTITGVYHEIVHFMRNIFNVPSGRAGKAFIEELKFGSKLRCFESFYGAPNLNPAKAVSYFEK